MAVMKSFELNGNKQSFANWISNLSPCDTPFTSMIGKEGITQSQYSWQADTLAPADNTAYEEGSFAQAQARESTHVITNFTSILRKVVHVSDSAEAVSAHGRGSEISYQMKKAGKEILRDLELMNLHHVDGNPATNRIPGRFYGFEGLCSGIGDIDNDTGAITHKAIDVLNLSGPWFRDSDIFDITYNLYLAGSKADKIMFHPKHAMAFSAMIANNPNSNQTYRMFDNMDNTYNAQVSKIKDPLGRVYTLIPNRIMPEDKIYFFNEADWTQMVLRSPTTSKLSKSGSSERFLMEMEVGLRHKHIFASGILTMHPTDVTIEFEQIDRKLTDGVSEETLVGIIAKRAGVEMDGADVQWHSSNEEVFTIKDSEATTTAGEASATIVTEGLGSATLTVTVDGIPLEAVLTVLNPSVTVAMNPPSMITGETSIATATITKANGETAGAGVRVNWVVNPSENVEIGSIMSTSGADGTATTTLKGLKAGVVEVSARVGSVTSRGVPLDIKTPEYVITVSANPNPYPDGTDVEVSATVTSKGVPVVGKAVTWIVTPDPVSALPPVNTDAQGVAKVTLQTSGNSDYQLIAVCSGILSPTFEIKGA